MDHRHFIGKGAAAAPLMDLSSQGISKTKDALNVGTRNGDGAGRELCHR
ncbi:hypothetical protein [Polynucleobacter sp.]|jgi:hypothetical protein